MSHLIFDNEETPEVQIDNYKSLVNHLEGLGVEVWYPQLG